MEYFNEKKPPLLDLQIVNQKFMDFDTKSKTKNQNVPREDKIKSSAESQYQLKHRSTYNYDKKSPVKSPKKSGIGLLTPDIQ